jgi:hypothetical protein
MRRLTLILSDLYLPEEHAPSALEMPNLEWLLRFARERAAVGDWRAVMADMLGLETLRRVPPAQVAARGLMPAPVAATAWFATPVGYDLHINHVRLNPRGLLRVAPDEGAQWCTAFTRDFGADFALTYAGVRGFLITGLAPVDAPTTDPARLLGADVVGALRPAGESLSVELARTATEIEFWLHAAPLNAARERARRPRISSLWLWGGGMPDLAAAAAVPRTAIRPPRLFGEDPYLGGLARTLGQTTQSAPRDFDGLPPDAGDTVVELMPMSGTQEEALANLDARWFAPARAALARGELDLVELLANDRYWRIARGAGRRFWRRGHPWLASLGLPMSAAKA